MNKQLTRGSIVLGIAVLLTLFFIRVPEVGESVDEHSLNSGELTGNAVIGQTFIASRNNISGIGIMMATYSGRDNTHPVVLHIREAVALSGDIRTVSANPNNFGDNQFYNFAFKPIANSLGKTYFFAVTSPDAVHGNAIAIDLNTQDPYHNGTSYIIRDSNTEVTDKLLQTSGKQNVDVAFQISYNVPVGTYIYHSGKHAINAFISTWQTNRNMYVLWIRAIIPGLLCIGLVIFLFRTKKELPVWQILLGLAVGAFIIRIIYATSLPFTDDEGNYLYDAWSLLHGHFAGGDGYVKAPMVIVWIALWEGILGHSALAGRISSIIAGSALVYPIFILVKSLFNTRAALISSALWAFMGTCVVATLYVHTQSVAIFFGVSGIALLAYALKEKQGDARWLISAGLFIGLAVASRKSMLGLGLTVLLLLLSLSPTFNKKLVNTFAVGIGFLTILALFFTFSYAVYGTEGVIEAIGINSAEDGANSNDPEAAEQIRTYSLKGMTPFFRESLPIILFSLLGIGFSLQNSIKTRFPTSDVGNILARLLWLVPLAVYWWAWSFFGEYEGAAFMKYGISLLWPLFGVVLLTAALTPSRSPLSKGEKSDGQHWATALIGPLWVGSFIFFYMNWIKFHANYISEFIPPLAIMGGIGIEAFIVSAKHIKIKWLSAVPILGLLVIGLWSASVSNFITYLFEHTGTFDQKAANEAAAWAKSNIPASEAIFTGASLIPYLSGHHTALDISHPRWYAYEFTRTNPKRLETFLPPTKDLVAAFKQSHWFIMDAQTKFSFLNEYDDINNDLKANWKSVKGISNGSNTITFYERVK